MTTLTNNTASPRQRFSDRHPADGWFWAVFLSVCLALILTGFAEPVAQRFRGQSPHPASLALVVHVWSYSAWIMLLAGQATLIALGRPRLHRRAGLAMLPLAAVMAWSGVVSQIEGDSLRYEQRPQLLAVMPLPLSFVAMFLGCVVAAWTLRRQPAWHKRFVFLATAALMGGPFQRALGPHLFPLLPPGVVTEFLINYGGIIVFAALGVSYDLVTRGRVHGAYLYGVPALLLVMASAIATTRSGWWPPIALRLVQ